MGHRYMSDPEKVDLACRVIRQLHYEVSHGQPPASGHLWELERLLHDLARLPVPTEKEIRARSYKGQQ